jgi:7-cyano-7-deazaguanine reductase
VPADSPQLIESKSLKLYLNSLCMTPFASIDEITKVVAADLSHCAAATVGVTLTPLRDAPGVLHALPGHCIDTLDVECDARRVDSSLLELAGDRVVAETLHSHLLRSNCPVTGQPDLGSILVRYRGRAIDHGSLLRYLVSYRRHSGFHESCVERIFVDLQGRCRPQQLTVYARYNRRGGLDINPFRSDFEAGPENLRLWRQ